MSLRLFGTTFCTTSAADVLSLAAAEPRTSARLVVTANVDHIVSLSENAAFRKAYHGAAARTLDGVPLVWLARLAGARNASRVTGHDLLREAISGAQPSDRRVFLVASCDVAGERVGSAFIAGGLAPEGVACESPAFGFERDEAYSLALAQRIRSHGTTLLIIGVGAPKSEIWIDRYRVELGDPLVLSVGEALNVAAGIIPRAPPLMQRLGLEWFFRFMHAPRRLFGRYFLRSWRFLWIAASTRCREVPGSTRAHVGIEGSLDPSA